VEEPRKINVATLIEEEVTLFLQEKREEIIQRVLAKLKEKRDDEKIP